VSSYILFLFPILYIDKQYINLQFVNNDIGEAGLASMGLAICCWLVGDHLLLSDLGALWNNIYDYVCLLP
jgi:hypothetical protein